MSLNPIIRSQYRASLMMLLGAIDACDNGLWLSASYRHPFWRVAYHALFYADLYLSPSEKQFAPWPKSIAELHYLGPIMHEGGRLPKEGPPYTKHELHEYTQYVLAKVDSSLEQLDPNAASGFFWLAFGKVELQFYNIRHIQHHAGQLIERIRQHLDKPVMWIGAA